MMSATLGPPPAATGANRSDAGVKPAEPDRDGFANALRDADPRQAPAAKMKARNKAAGPTNGKLQNTPAADAGGVDPNQAHLLEKAGKDAMSGSEPTGAGNGDTPHGSDTALVDLPVTEDAVPGDDAVPFAVPVVAPQNPEPSTANSAAATPVSTNAATPATSLGSGGQATPASAAAPATVQASVVPATAAAEAAAVDVDAEAPAPKGAATLTLSIRPASAVGEAAAPTHASTVAAGGRESAGDGPKATPAALATPAPQNTAPTAPGVVAAPVGDPTVEAMPGALGVVPARTEQAIRTAVTTPIVPGAQAHAALASEVAGRVHMSITNGGKQIMLDMRPPELGHIVVRMVMNDGVLQAQIVADRPEAAKMLEQAMPHLAEALAQHGYDLAGMDVAHHGQDQDASAGTTRNGGAHDQASPDADLEATVTVRDDGSVPLDLLA